MENVTRTVYGARLQSALLLGLPLEIAPNSTMNQDLGIQENVAIAQTDRPAMRYLAIGNGGHIMRVGTNNISRPVPVQHKATDASLYNQLPFVLRAVTNDLSATERGNYGLRRLEVHDGIQYIAYYLKRLDFSDVRTVMEYKTVANNQTTTTEFIPNTSNLEPVPPALSNTGVNVTTGDYVSATAKVPFKLTEAEVTELLDVANIIYGDNGYAMISEMALCSGVDKLITVNPGTGSAFNFNEVVATQIVTFVSSFFSLLFNNSGVNVLLDLGATEPLGVFTSNP
jgi:hypothetical protein